MGAPKGNQNAARAKEFRDALRWSLENYSDSAIERGQALRGITTALVQAAMSGEPWAVKEIADRIDGRPAQVVTGEDGSSAFVLRLVTGDE